MSTLLIRNCRAIVTCDDGDRVYENADLFCQDGFIQPSPLHRNLDNHH